VTGAALPGTGRPIRAAPASSSGGWAPGRPRRPRAAQEPVGLREP